MVTEREVQELIAHSPNLYHMAERGSWPSIRENGLLSTTALLDLYSVTGETREKIERCHRPSCVQLSGNNLPRAVIRDQIPMRDSDLRKCLPDHMRPSDWYQILNKKVFFWLTESRLQKLTCARAYRNREHEVLIIDSCSLIEAHWAAIWLCAINSGCTRPFARWRDESIFSRIEEYPYSQWRRARGRGERVVELAIDYAVPDICDHVRSVVVMKGRETISVVE